MLIVIFLLGGAVFFGMNAYAVEGSENAQPAANDKLVLSEVIMCEKIVNELPQNPSVVFPVSVKNAYCYTVFGNVPEKTDIWHRWYRRDKLVTKIKLVVEPPRWATYSGIHIRESDKGPWRVEVIDQEGNVLTVKRFSISE